MQIEAILLWAAATFGQVPPAAASPEALLVWDPVTTNIAGEPEVIQGYEVGLLPAGSDWRQGGVPLNVLPASPQEHSGYSLKTLLAGRPSGTSYNLQVKAVDQAGLRSDPSGPLAVTVDSVKPAVPAGLRIVVNVQVVVGQ